jgi:translation initiation factor 4E
MRRGKNSNKEPVTAKAEGEETQGASGAVNPYENSIKIIATIHSVEQFWRVYDYLMRPNDLPTTTDYHFFREGIKPTWEDSSNAKGGKWIVRLKKGLASRYWEEVILALIGGQFTGIPDGEVCGAVISIRFSEDIVSIWNRTATDRDVTDRLRDAIKRILQLPSHVHMVRDSPFQNQYIMTHDCFKEEAVLLLIVLIYFIFSSSILDGYQNCDLLSW